ncbi:MAG: arginine decarboxylase, partial [Myxococcota bacterium]
VLGGNKQGMEIISRSRDVESFFFRDDVVSDPEFLIGYILNDFADRMKTPFWTSYRKYVIESNDSWHTPGHSNGTSFRSSPYLSDFYRFYGRNVFAGDLSVSVDSLGSLSDSSHVIGEAQKAAAYTFEVQRTYFITNGSSTSNKIVMQSVLRPGDKVIIDRNCHKSVHYGMVQANAYPIYLNSQLNSQWGLFAPPRLADIAAAIKANPDTRLIVLTGCTYEGLLIDVRQVVKMAHEAGIKVFIDEAWFAYSLFHPAFRHYSAINSGADYITHSAHKVLSAFSQASYIHVNDPDFDPDFFRDIYNIYSSTSPKYQLIAALDVCHMQVEMEGYKLFNNLLTHVAEFKKFVKRLSQIRVLDHDDFIEMFPHFREENVGHDPLKILIDISQLRYSTEDIHRFLMDEIGMEVEKFTHSTFLVLLTIGGTHSKMIRLYNALKKLDDGIAHLSKTKPRSRTAIPEQIPPINLAVLPSEAFFGKRRAVPYTRTVGMVSATLVTPYPPGIPLLVPGQWISQEHIDFLQSIHAPKVTIQGMFDGDIYVMAEPPEDNAVLAPTGRADRQVT